MTTSSSDFNHIREWLVPKLRERGWSVEKLSRQAGLSKAAIYFYLDDTYRPDESSMAAICKALGVPFEEGLQQYTPRQPGRPKGSRPGVRELSVRRR